MRELAHMAKKPWSTVGGTELGTRIMHYCIALGVAEHFDLDRNRFILGSLAPDAHSGSLHGKVTSHFQVAEHSLDPNFFDVEKFMGRYIREDGRLDAFLLGYCCHLLSDNEWFKVIFTRYLPCGFRSMYSHCVQCDAEEENRRVTMCYEDYSKLNRILIARFGLSRESLRIPDETPVEEIQPERLSGLADGLYSDFQTPTGLLALFDVDVVVAHVSHATDKCMALMERFRGR